MPSDGGVALVFGARGGIGAAVTKALESSDRHAAVVGVSRATGFDLTDEASIARTVETAAMQGEIRLAIDATGFLHDKGQAPEKSLRDLDAAKLARAFALNAIGPALIMKHLLPRLPRTGRAVFATLSARVGSIGDNRLGGWYGYRASKAALNQMVRTASIELARRAPEAVCVALHPGTVRTALSAPFVGEERDAVSPDQSAENLLRVIDGLRAEDTGGFFDWRGDRIEW
ncbi:MAG: SDR family NAD(P)-dependent oxidoreductase [Rhodoblastus sp.]